MDFKMEIFGQSRKSVFPISMNDNYGFCSLAPFQSF